MFLVSIEDFRFLVALKRHSFSQPLILVPAGLLPTPSPSWATSIGGCQASPLVEASNGGFSLTPQGSTLSLEDQVRVQCEAAPSVKRLDQTETCADKPRLDRGSALPQPPSTSTCGRNITARWFELNYKVAHQALTRMVARRFVTSAAAGMSEDHIQEFIMVMVRRDGFSKRLAEGRGIWISDLLKWAWNQISSQLRNAGRRPLTRHLMSARTTAELKAAKALKPAEITAQPAVSSPSPLYSQYGADYDSAPDECMAIVHSVLQRRRVLKAGIKAEIWKRWVLEGSPAHEIAKAEGLPLGTTQNYLREVKITIAECQQDFIRAFAHH